MILKNIISGLGQGINIGVPTLYIELGFDLDSDKILISDLLPQIQRATESLICIIGEEPALEDDLGLLITNIQSLGKLVSVETNCGVWNEGLLLADLLILKPNPASDDYNPYVMSRLITEGDNNRELRWVVETPEEFDFAIEAIDTWYPPDSSALIEPQIVFIPEPWERLEQSMKGILSRWSDVVRHKPYFKRFWIRVL
jgi:hypothetical protein